MIEQDLFLPIHIEVFPPGARRGIARQAFDLVEQNFGLNQVAKQSAAEVGGIKAAENPVPIGIVALRSQQVALRFSRKGVALLLILRPDLGSALASAGSQRT